MLRAEERSSPTPSVILIPKRICRSPRCLNTPVLFQALRGDRLMRLLSHLQSPQNTRRRTVELGKSRLSLYRIIRQVPFEVTFLLPSFLLPSSPLTGRRPQIREYPVLERHHPIHRQQLWWTLCGIRQRIHHTQHP